MAKRKADKRKPGKSSDHVMQSMTVGRGHDVVMPSNFTLLDSTGRDTCCYVEKGSPGTLSDRDRDFLLRALQARSDLPRALEAIQEEIQRIRESAAKI